MRPQSLGDPVFERRSQGAFQFDIERVVAGQAPDDHRRQAPSILVLGERDRTDFAFGKLGRE